ncbi:MAG: hypothetical protein ACLUD2_02730 [Clostridium sp.]
MLYTGIIAALSSLDLGIKWLIEQEKPEELPKPLPHAKGKILLYRNHNAGFPFGFLEQHGRACADAAAGGDLRTGRFSGCDPSAERKTYRNSALLSFLAALSAIFMTA